MAKSQVVHCIQVLVLLALCFVGACSAQTDAPLPDGVKAVWELDQASCEKSPTRACLCLNGLWRWQPAAADAGVPSDNWGFFKVPGPWPAGNDSYDRKESQKAYAHPGWKNQNLNSITKAWYQREFTVPADWAGRRVVLSVEYLNSVATVYVDGKKIGNMRFPAAELDLTAAVQPAGKHVLSVMTEALPLKATMLAFTDTHGGNEVKGEVRFKGLCGDVYLLGTPAQARVTHIKVETSVRQWTLATHADMAGLTPGAEYKLQAKILDKGQTVKTLTSPVFKEADLKDGRFSFTEAWKPEKLWDLNTPQNQYDLELSLLDAAGKAVDVCLPVRFGFREMWIEGRDFKFNGTRLFCSVVPIDSTTQGAGTASYAAARETMERLQSIGINMVYTHNYDCKPGSHVSFEEMLRAADDTGMLVSFSQPHFSDYDWKAADAAQKNGYAQHAAFYVHVAENHPSVVAYSTSHNQTGYFEGMNPDLIDGVYQPKDGGNRAHALMAEAVIRKLDPSRIVYHHSSGNLGAMWTYNFYLNFVPIQERSDWFEHWATKGEKPAVIVEYGMPYFLTWTMYRGFYKGKLPWQGGGTVPYEFCLAEWDSQWLGDSAFKLGEMEKADLRWEAKQFNAGKTWHHWDYKPYIYDPHFDQQQEVIARYTADNWRAFRTWGVSGISPWTYAWLWKLGEVHKGRKDFKVDWEKLQRPGYSVDFTDQSSEDMAYAFERADWIPTVAGKVLVRNNGPLLAYIGGKPGAFTEKGHNFRAGESVEKQVVAINNSRGTVSCDCKWSLNLPTPLTGAASFTAPTGDIHMQAFKFTLPAELKPGAYTLVLSVKFTPGESQEDSFTINVLAHDPAQQAGANKMAIFDPPGETTKLFAALGVRGEAVQADADLSKYDVLVVGKDALTPEGPGPNLRRVPEGLRVLVFEQHADVLEQRFGFRVQEYGLRETFRRVPDHPVLAGLDDENLRDWRGEATNMAPRLTYMTLPYPIQGPTVVNAGLQVSRAWRCGNRSNVASVLIEKPACGDFLALVDGGYSLQYSALMEYREGQGMVLFCQMDVTARTEGDPAAERLARNLLTYAGNWKPAPHRTILYAGDPAGQKHLQQAGFAVEPYAAGALKAGRVLVVSAGGGAALAADKDAIAAWLKQDGRVLALGMDAAEAGAFLPVKVETKTAEHIGTFFEPQAATSPLVGVGPADVHNRDPRNLPLVTGGAQAVGDGVLASADEGRVVFCQLAPWQFNPKQQNTKRTFRRTSCLLTRVLGNLGVQAQTPLLERFTAQVKLRNGQSPECRWLHGFYLEPPEEWDDPYRFFGW
ncbi:MAG TPA: glycoside hydrolase family 2 TIM barrel-domain containing protein [Planctomycetota bacterium]|nr:glycoside hydrolase family 2 TIM barrel-domain containing protein [Planctomycetota bacterium]